MSIPIGYEIKIDNLSPNFLLGTIPHKMASESTSQSTRLLYGKLDMSKYPSRTGQLWKKEEIEQLLQSIQEKKSIDAISKEHCRTVGGITSRLKVIAADYHFNDKLPIEEIMKITNLSTEQIKDAIAKREFKQSVIKEGKKTSVVREKTEPRKKVTIDDMYNLLLTVSGKLDILLAKIE
jgi:hypothetical protein